MAAIGSGFDVPTQTWTSRVGCFSDKFDRVCTAYDPSGILEHVSSTPCRFIVKQCISFWDSLDLSGLINDIIGTAW